MRKGRSHRLRPRTDVGTVLLHWLAVGSVATSLATGLAIAADAPERRWLEGLRWLLPAGEVWSVHVVSGLTLAAISAAYVAYVRSAGLGGRVRLDRARLFALTGPARARWGAMNVLIYWLGFGALATLMATGLLLYLGHGGWVVTAHYVAALGMLAFPVLHVAAQLALGGMPQLLRILRPTRRIEASPPPDLIELVRRHLARGGEARRPPGPHTLHAHPLAIACAVGLATVSIAATLDMQGPNRLVVRAIKPADAPRLDGDLADAAWRGAMVTTIETQQGANLGGTGASRVTVRAVHDGTFAYLAFTWEDPTRSLKHLPLIKRADGWHLLHTRYDIEDEDSYYEDKFSVMLAESARLPAAGSIHLGAKPLAGMPGAYSGRGLHYTADGSIVDVWHWKAARGGLLGFVDDNYFGPPAEPTDKEKAGKSRYKAGYKTDSGNASFANNFDHQPAGGYAGPLAPKRLPKDLAQMRRAMGPINLDPEASEPPEARWWMLGEESEPYTAAADQRIPVGTVIPGVLINGEYTGDRGHVRCAASWAAGQWTLEIARLLDTGSKQDIAIRGGNAMWVAVFDHTQTRHTRHLRPVILEVQQ